MKYLELCTKLRSLEAQIKELKAEGDILIGASIDSSMPGGTARGNPSIQYRLRVQGQKARYLKPGEVASARAAIARGRQLRKLQGEVERLQIQIKRITTKADKLGLVLPEL